MSRMPVNIIDPVTQSTAQGINTAASLEQTRMQTGSQQAIAGMQINAERKAQANQQAFQAKQQQSAQDFTAQQNQMQREMQEAQAKREEALQQQRVALEERALNQSAKLAKAQASLQAAIASGASVTPSLIDKIFGADDAPSPSAPSTPSAPSAPTTPPPIDKSRRPGELYKDWKHRILGLEKEQAAAQQAPVPAALSKPESKTMEIRFDPSKPEVASESKTMEFRGDASKNTFAPGDAIFADSRRTPVQKVEELGDGLKLITEGDKVRIDGIEDFDGKWMTPDELSSALDDYRSNIDATLSTIQITQPMRDAIATGAVSAEKAMTLLSTITDDMGKVTTAALESVQREAETSVANGVGSLGSLAASFEDQLAALAGVPQKAVDNARSRSQFGYGLDPVTNYDAPMSPAGPARRDAVDALPKMLVSDALSPVLSTLAGKPSAEKVESLKNELAFYFQGATMQASSQFASLDDNKKKLLGNALSDSKGRLNKLLGELDPEARGLVGAAIVGMGNGVQSLKGAVDDPKIAKAAQALRGGVGKVLTDTRIKAAYDQQANERKAFLTKMNASVMDMAKDGVISRAEMEAYIAKNEQEIVRHNLTFNRSAFEGVLPLAANDETVGLINEGKAAMKEQDKAQKKLRNVMAVKGRVDYTRKAGVRAEWEAKGKK